MDATISGSGLLKLVLVTIASCLDILTLTMAILPSFSTHNVTRSSLKS